MRWIVVWVAVFFASVSAFVAMPRPALLWVANSLDVFGDAIGHVALRTSRPVEPVSGEDDASAKRREIETLQADRAGGVPAVAPPRTRADESESRSGAKTCRPATIRLTQPWRPETEPDYVASFGAFAPDFEVEPDEQWEQLGEHRTSSILEASTKVQTRCDRSTCRTCVVEITARIGFAPSEIRLHEDLRGNYCARALTIQHEQEHAAVTRKAQAIAVEEARRNLAWARYRQAAHVSPAGGQKAAQQEVIRKVEQNLMRALQKAVDYADRANALLDQPERYRRESQRQWRLCRSE